MAHRFLLCFASLALICSSAIVAVTNAVVAVTIALAGVFKLFRPDPAVLFVGPLDGARLDNMRLDRRPRLAWLNAMRMRPLPLPKFAVA